MKFIKKIYNKLSPSGEQVNIDTPQIKLPSVFHNVEDLKKSLQASLDERIEANKRINLAAANIFTELKNKDKVKVDEATKILNKSEEELNLAKGILDTAKSYQMRQLKNTWCSC